MTNQAVRTNTLSASTSRSRQNRRPVTSLASSLHRRFSRRSFLGVAAGAAATLTVAESGRGQSGGQTEQRTLYFDFSYLPDPTVPIIAVIGDTQYPLARVAQASATAKLKMSSHKLLQSLPSGTATHLLENVSLPANALQGGYLIVSPNYTTGEWSMLPMFINIPSTASAQAFTRLRNTAGPSEPLRLSNRRRKYLLPAASTLQDFLADADLVDASSHAAALTSLHPDILSIEPAAHAYVAAQHVASNPDVDNLHDGLIQLGPATPAVVEGQDNPMGWATLQPLRDENGAIMKRPDGLNNYSPVPTPIYEQLASAAQASTRADVKNDESLGMDTTSTNPATAASAFQGKLWQRRDAVTYVDQSIIQRRPRAAASLDPVFDITATPEVNIGDGASVQVTNSGTSVTVTLKNWYLRWLVVHLQFHDEGGTLLTKDQLPPFDTGVWNDQNALAVGCCSPAFFEMGIPTGNPGSFSYTFEFPAKARTVRLLAGGIGTGAEPADSSLTALGEVLTGVFQFTIPVIAIAAGLPPLETLGATVIRTFALPILIGALNVDGAAAVHSNMVTVTERAAARAAAPIAGGLVSLILTTAIKQFAERLPQIIANNVPVVGWIFRAINAAAAAAEIGITSYDVANSPNLYSWDIKGTQDITIKILPDPLDNQMPQSATRYELNAIFGDSVPHQITKTAGTLGDSITETLQSVPIGGMVTYNIGLYQSSGYLVGNGSTGAIQNNAGNPPNITITEHKVPIASNTSYVHKQKSALDAAGNHVWNVTSVAPAPRVNACAGPGSICQFHSITVRQGTAAGPGYIGYSWSGNSSNLNPCRPTSTATNGQQDQMANLGTNSTPQNGYTIASCGLQPGGTKLAYNLLGDDSSHYYLDHANRAVRQVKLNPPAFDNPAGGLAHAMLNLDSDAITLHPSGRIVSVNSGAHILEAGSLAGTAVPDAQARKGNLALVFSGQGTRPGRLTAPAAVAMTPKGTVLVLEQGTNRIQALDHTARPVKLFSKQPSPYFLYLDGTKGPDTLYLDITVEFDGYIYVLSADHALQNYRLDIYHPDQADTRPVVTTRGVNAARLAVDYWRNVYVLNTEPLTKPDGTLPNFAEPSVSVWVPIVGFGTPEQRSTRAVAGPKGQTSVLVDFVLDGTDSTSADAKPLSYGWTSLDGRAAIGNATSARPVVQFATGPGVYAFRLVVTDQAGRTASDVVSVTYLGR